MSSTFEKIMSLIRKTTSVLEINLYSLCYNFSLKVDTTKSQLDLKVVLSELEKDLASNNDAIWTINICQNYSHEIKYTMAKYKF